MNSSAFDAARAEQLRMQHAIKQSFRGESMSYEQFTSAMATLKHAKNYLRAQRGQGDCAAAIVRNQAINLLNDAEFALVGDYARQGAQ